MYGVSAIRPTKLLWKKKQAHNPELFLPEKTVENNLLTHQAATGRPKFFGGSTHAVTSY
jgi:hypothetical protein